MNFTRLLRTSLVTAGMVGALGVGPAHAFEPAGVGQSLVPVTTSAVPDLPALPAAPATPAGLSDLPAPLAVGDLTGGLPTIPGLAMVPGVEGADASDGVTGSGTDLLGTDLLAAPDVVSDVLPGVHLPSAPLGQAGGAVTGPVQGDAPGTILPDLSNAPGPNPTGLNTAGMNTGSDLPGLGGLTAGLGSPVTSTG